MPAGLRGLQMQIHDTHELTVDAYVNKDRQLLLRALCTDPIVPSIATAHALLDDLFAAQQADLEDWIGNKPSTPAAATPATVADTVNMGQTREGS
jgi:alpha-galactosidase/6-phospho-beta-glucosidase family protein